MWPDRFISYMTAISFKYLKLKLTIKNHDVIRSRKNEKYKSCKKYNQIELHKNMGVRYRNRESKGRWVE